MKHFDTQHSEMIELADAILAVVREMPADASNKLNSLRLRLSRAVSAHCNEEAALLCKAEDVPEGIVRRYHDELLQWRHALIACNSGWPPQRVWKDQRGFTAAFRPIVTALHNRIAWEQNEVYPVLRPLAA